MDKYPTLLHPTLTPTTNLVNFTPTYRRTHLSRGNWGPMCTPTPALGGGTPILGVPPPPWLALPRPTHARITSHPCVTVVGETESAVNQWQRGSKLTRGASGGEEGGEKHD
eukprot:750409-Hanusia_phi.AAC.4